MQIKKIAKQPIIMKLSTECNRYHRDGKSCGGRRSRCSIADQYTDWNEDRYHIEEHLRWQIRPVVSLVRSVKPIAVRMVYQVAQAVNIPIIGMGGISCAEDAIEFLLAGASAVSVGTANFHNPAVTMEVIDGIEAYMKKNGFETVKDMVGIVK